MRQTTSANAVYGLLRLPQVQASTGLSRSEIYRRVRSGDFPAPVKLGERASAWVEREIVEWAARRIAERDAKAVA
ncbi:helix-turn-helix transcriptional regulator [Marilutibacter spongiae]|uniref:AlpA family transcriptional regulator n=1 Tax=Marilutibacter spongiae TaxID=2025720 RepID=A0A7W3Y726_9GAMM|nr:AlpA family transcriptional regulator [Lysobacter spongiae]MBB1061862.1 AlpA family transcriptional regulator [Lysobacter spongiae]